MAPLPTICPPAEKAALSPYRHFVIAAVIYLLILQCVALLPSLPGSLAGNADFRSLYGAGLLVRSGGAHSLYDDRLQQQFQNSATPRSGWLPYIYPAYVSLLFAPLSWLSYRAAYAVYFGVNLFLLWLSARLLRESLPHLPALWPPLGAALFYCYIPATVALMHGQTSILLLSLYCGAYALLHREKPLWAGVLVGLAMFKMQIALPIAMLFFLWRRWRFVAGFVSGAGIAAAISLWLTGYQAFVQYWRSLFLMASSSSSGTAQFCIPPYMMANLYGLSQLLPIGAVWGARLATAASLLLFVWMASRPASLPMAIVGALLMSRYLGVHDLALLLLPIAVSLDRVAAQPFHSRTRANAIIALLLLFPPVYLFTMGRHLVPWLALVLLAFAFCLAGPKTQLPASS